MVSWMTVCWKPFAPLLKRYDQNFLVWLLAAERRLQDAITILAEFMRADMSRIRNKSAYLSGVISRFKNDRYLNSIECVFNSISLIWNQIIFSGLENFPGLLR